ncbi:beta strand repeat-containing protein [Verrucomicrobiota bacterium sgz303538]
MLPIEVLENRIAPAAIITVSLDKGALTLNADDGDHEFSVTALDSSTFELKAVGDTLFQMGSDAPIDTLLLTSPLKSLTATLGDGADKMSLIGLSIGGNVTIDGGAGDNSLNLSTVAVKGGLQVSGGSGMDAINATGTLSVKKDAILDLAAGDNSLVVAGDNFQVGGNFSYTGGSGADGLTVVNGVMSVGKEMSLKFGSGNGNANVAAISSFSVGKNLIFDTSASLAEETTSFGLLSLMTRIGGDVRVTDGAASSTFTIASAGSVGKINVESGAGAANATVAYLQLKTKAIEFDASKSSESSLQVVGLGSAGSATAIKYTGGVGTDGLTAIGIGGASVIAELGDGDNSAMLANIGGSAKTIKVTSGTGTDSIIVAVVSGNTSNVDIQSGNGNDNVVVAVANGSASNIDIESGTGTKQTTLVLANAKVSGNISITHPAADAAAFNSAFLNAKIGNLEYTSGAATNVLSFGFAGGSFPIPIGGIPGIPGADPEADPVVGSFSLVSGLSVTKGIHVVTGGGNDKVSFDGNMNVKVGQGIDLELGAGDNEVSGTVTNFVTKSLKVTGGDGADLVTLGGSGNFGAVALTLGAGANSAILSGGVVPLAIASLSFVSTGAADTADSLTLARIISAGNLSANFGAGASTLRINDSTIGGSSDADTGAGGDLVEIDAAATNAGTVLVKAATIKLGDGDDTLILGGNGTSSLLTTKSTFSADGGSGTNTLTNGAGNVLAKDPKFLSFAP